MNSSIDRFVRDRRGAIMIFGVVMGVLLVGALWQIASVGNAIIWRERAQDAADAAAFENAVWHARGMNLLVSLNLIMQVILAVLVFWRMVFLMVGVAAVIMGIACGFFGIESGGTACAVEARILQAANWMRKYDHYVVTGVTKVLGGMRVAEYAVSEATPALAWKFSGSHTTDAYPAVTDATTWSASLLPSFNTEAIKDIAKCFVNKKEGGGKEGGGKEGGGDSTSGGTPPPDDSTWKKIADGYVKGLKGYDAWVGTPRLSMPLSLPVEAGEYADLCGDAGKLVVDSLGELFDVIGLGAIGSVLSHAGGSVADIVKKSPEVFCAPMDKSVAANEALGDIQKAAGDKCTGEFGENKAILAPNSDPKNPTYYPYTYDPNDKKAKKPKPVNKDDWLGGCKKKKVDDAKDELNSTIKESTESAEVCGKPAAVWGFAKNGSVFMRSFSSITQRDTTSSHDDRGLDVADGARTGNVVAVQTGEVDAHAEMYFDCKGGWDKCGEEAMWNLMWEARLRRVQPLMVLASSAAEQIGVTTLEKIAGKANDTLMDELLHGKFHVSPISPGVVVGTGIYKFLTEKGIDKGGEFLGEKSGIREWVLHHGGSSAVIH